MSFDIIIFNVNIFVHFLYINIATFNIFLFLNYYGLLRIIYIYTFCTCTSTFVY